MMSYHTKALTKLYDILYGLMSLWVTLVWWGSYKAWTNLHTSFYEACTMPASWIYNVEYVFTVRHLQLAIYMLVCRVELELSIENSQERRDLSNTTLYGWRNCKQMYFHNLYVKPSTTIKHVNHMTFPGSIPIPRLHTGKVENSQTHVNTVV